MKETWSRDEASHEIDLNIEALRALTHTTTAPACTFAHKCSQRDKRMPQKMKRGPEDISKADLPCSGKQYPTDIAQNVNPQPW